LLEFVEELQKNGSIEYFNFVNGQIIGKAKDVEALKATNASVEAILSFSQPIEFFWYGSGFSVAPNNFKETTTFIPISMVDFSQHQPKVKVFILAQFSRNLSVISYSISLFQT